MHECNGWPTRSTWLVAVWLADNKQNYRQDLILAVWTGLRGKPRASLLARSRVAARIERDVLANRAQMAVAEPVEIDAVAWISIADH